jgi:AhpD family alkylhydroperoxidase
MTSFPIHTADTAPEAARPILAGVKAGWGFVPNLHAKLAAAPAALQAYAHLFDLFGTAGFTPAEQQVAYLTVSAIHECEYCVSGHSVLAANAGLDAATIEALREGRPLPMRGCRRCAPSAARWCMPAAGCSPASSRPSSPPATRGAGARPAVAVAAKTISNYANHLAGTPLDAFMAKTSWVAPSRRQRAPRDGRLQAELDAFRAEWSRKAPAEAQALIAAQIESLRAGGAETRILPAGAALPDLVLPDAGQAPRRCATSRPR